MTLPLDACVHTGLDKRVCQCRGCVTDRAPVNTAPFDGPGPGFRSTIRADELGSHAKKMDVGKAPIGQGFFNYFGRAIFAVAWVSEYGDRKYTQPGKPHYSTAWQNVVDGEARYGDADCRHRLKPQMEGDYDAESGLAHLAHKAWNAMAELELALKTGRVEMRIGNEVKDGRPVPDTFKVVPL